LGLAFQAKLNRCAFARGGMVTMSDG